MATYTRVVNYNESVTPPTGDLISQWGCMPLSVEVECDALPNLLDGVVPFLSGEPECCCDDGNQFIEGCGGLTVDIKTAGFIRWTACIGKTYCQKPFAFSAQVCVDGCWKGGYPVDIPIRVLNMNCELLFVKTERLTECCPHNIEFAFGYPADSCGGGFMIEIDLPVGIRLTFDKVTLVQSERPMAADWSEIWRGNSCEPRAGYKLALDKLFCQITGIRGLGLPEFESVRDFGTYLATTTKTKTIEITGLVGCCASSMSDALKNRRGLERIFANYDQRTRRMKAVRLRFKPCRCESDECGEVVFDARLVGDGLTYSMLSAGGEVVTLKLEVETNMFGAVEHCKSLCTKPAEYTAQNVAIFGDDGVPIAAPALPEAGVAAAMNDAGTYWALGASGQVYEWREDDASWAAIGSPLAMPARLRGQHGTLYVVDTTGIYSWSGAAYVPVAIGSFNDFLITSEGDFYYGSNVAPYFSWLNPVTGLYGLPPGMVALPGPTRKILEDCASGCIYILCDSGAGRTIIKYCRRDSVFSGEAPPIPPVVVAAAPEQNCGACKQDGITLSVPKTVLNCGETVTITAVTATAGSWELYQIDDCDCLNVGLTAISSSSINVTAPNNAGDCKFCIRYKNTVGAKENTCSICFTVHCVKPPLKITRAGSAPLNCSGTDTLSVVGGVGPYAWASSTPNIGTVSPIAGVTTTFTANNTNTPGYALITVTDSQGATGQFYLPVICGGGIGVMTTIVSPAAAICDIAVNADCRLIAHGTFGAINGVSANGYAAWNGAAWSAPFPSGNESGCGLAVCGNSVWHIAGNQVDDTNDKTWIGGGAATIGGIVAGTNADGQCVMMAVGTFTERLKLPCVTRISYCGTVATSPIIVFNNTSGAPRKITLLENRTTGKKLNFSFVNGISPGVADAVTIQAKSGRVISKTYGDVTYTIRARTPLAGFTLSPPRCGCCRWNEIAILADSEIDATIYWRDEFDSVAMNHGCKGGC